MTARNANDRAIIGGIDRRHSKGLTE